MTLSERLSNQPSNGNGAPAPSAPVSTLTLISPKREVRDSAEAAGYRELKQQILDHLLQTLDVAKLDSLDPALVTGRIGAAITERLREQERLVTDTDRLRLIEEVRNEILGLGPLEP